MAGFLASAVFTCLAAVRDVYLGGLFQRVSPLILAIAAFSLCSVVFFPLALARGRGSLRVLLQRPRRLLGVNATSAVAWIAFFYALQTTEPLLVQILFSGVGPLSVMWVDRLVTGARSAQLGPTERPVHLGLLGALLVAAAVALGGSSGTGPQPFATAALGVGLALGAGISISINTVLCRQFNDEGVDPAALVSVRFLGAVAVAAALVPAVNHDVSALVPMDAIPGVLVASLLLIVLPIYVNQVGISLASPLTVRVVLATGPVLVFVLQVIEGRLSSSPYSLAAALVYGIFAGAAALARGRAIRSVVAPSSA